MQELIDIIDDGWDQRSRGDAIRGNEKLEAAVKKAILLLDNGRVLEDGTHDDLVRQAGRYAELYSLYHRQLAGSPG